MVSYFTDESMFRRVYRERMAAFGGGRAILLQTAHPLVVAGLLAHSAELDTFRRRLLRTQRVLETIGFGPRAKVDAMMDVVAEMHGRVEGRIPQDAGRFPKGTPFRATDPDLMLWVIFTMYDSSQLAYETFVRKLSLEERRGFWSDYRLVGRLFGLRGEDMPRTLEDAVAYRREMLEGDTLFVTEWARRRGREIALEPDDAIPSLVKPIVMLINWVTVALLPPRLQVAYGFQPAPWRREVPVRALGKAVGRTLPLLPKSVRTVPESRSAAEPWRHVAVGTRADGSRVLEDAVSHA